MRQDKLWTKDFIIVTVVNFLLTLVMYLLLVIIPSYATDHFHASTGTAGLVSGIFIIGALLGRFVIGRIIGDIGSKKILVMGLILYVITSALYLGVSNLAVLVVNRILHGIAYGIASTAAGTIMAQQLPYNRHGEGVGYYGMSAILATAVGPFLGLLLNQHADFAMIFTFNTVLAVASFALSFTIREPVQKSFKQDPVPAATYFHISNFIEFKAIPISIISLIMGFCFSGVLIFLSFYSKEIHLVEAASFFFFVYAVTILVSRPFSGRLFDIKGANVVAYPCLLIFAIGTLLFSQANHGATLLLAAALMGLGYGNFQSSAQAIAIKASPPRRLGLATATFYIFWDLGAGIGPYLLGFFVSFTGYRGLFLMLVFVILAAMLLYYLLIGRKNAPDDVDQGLESGSESV